MKNIAIIGSGISGLSAAWALRDNANVTVFEKASRIGGHSCTQSIDYDGKTMNVDVGFIVCNPLNYPNFMSFMNTLGVETQPSDMSFAVSDPKRFEWSSNPAGLFAQKRNLFRPSYWKLLREILTFNERAQADAKADEIGSELTLGRYLDSLSVSEDFRKHYILPMGAAIWSTPEAQMEDYPARSFLRFFNNHRLLHRERPQWRTVTGGSQAYVGKLASALGDRLRVNSEVTSINRLTSGGSELVLANGERFVFDHVILACHADEAHHMLGDGYEHQKAILAPVRFSDNKVVLHRDKGLMPKRKAAWASWNVLKSDDDKKPLTLSYWMNKLQNLDPKRPVFVTLNPEKPVRSEYNFGEFSFTHPIYNLDLAKAVDQLERFNGRNGLWFSGAWMGHGFHEDGLKSGLRVALALGAKLPWVPVDIPAFGNMKQKTIKTAAMTAAE